MSSKRIGPWLRKSTRDVYENPWIKVTHEEVETPAGTEGIYGKIHFKTHAVGVIPVDEQGNTWLVRQTRYPLEIQTWEIPEGGVPMDEDLLEGAKRELKEEVGLTATEWHELMELHTSNSVTDEYGKIFVASGLTQGEQQLEDSEDIELRKLPLQEAIAMVMNGEITDSISVAGLLRVALEMGDPRWAE